MELTNNLISPLANISLNVAMDGMTPMSFTIERQLMSNWCWAASTVAICKYYNRSAFSQQQIVAKVLNRPICVGPLNPFCNVAADLGVALKMTGHLFGDPFEGPLEPNQLLSALQNRRVVGCQMLIPDLGGHVVVLVGAKNDAQGNLFVQVADPSDGTQPFMPFTQFRNNFRATGGRWVRTYYTSPTSGLG